MVESSDQLSYSIQSALRGLENPEYRELEKVTIGVGGKYIQSKTRKLFLEFEERKCSRMIWKNCMNLQRNA